MLAWVRWVCNLQNSSAVIRRRCRTNLSSTVIGLYYNEVTSFQSDLQNFPTEGTWRTVAWYLYTSGIYIYCRCAAAISCGIVDTIGSTFAPWKMLWSCQSAHSKNPLLCFSSAVNAFRVAWVLEFISFGKSRRAPNYPGSLRRRISSDCSRTASTRFPLWWLCWK